MIKGYLEKWRVLKNGSPVKWCYRRRSSNGNKKGNEIFLSRQGRNRAVRRIMETEKGWRIREVRDTKSR